MTGAPGNSGNPLQRMAKKTSLVGPLLGIVGVVMSLAGAGFLVMSEMGAADQAQAFSNAQKAARSISADKIDASADGQILHIVGSATAKGILSDQDFGVQVPDAIALRRKTLKNQWEEGAESSQSIGHTYQLTWTDTLIDSDSGRQRISHQW